MLHSSADFTVDEHLVENGFQQIPVAGTAELEPGDLLGTSYYPLLRVPVASILHNDDDAPTTPGSLDESSMIIPEPAAGVFPASTCSGRFAHHLNETPPRDGPVPTKPTPANNEPPPFLLDRLNADHRDSFLQVWYKQPAHLRDISFDFHGPSRYPHIITQLGDILIEFSDVFSKSPTDFGSCSLLPFELSGPPDSTPVSSRRYRVNPRVAKQMDTIFDGYLAAGLMQHFTSPYASPVVIIPRKSGGIRLTINDKKLNNISILGQLPIPRVDHVLEKLGCGRIFSLFDLVSSFHVIKVHEDTIPFTAFCTPTRLFEWFVMPQRSNAAPGQFVKVINEVN